MWHLCVCLSWKISAEFGDIRNSSRLPNGTRCASLLKFIAFAFNLETFFHLAILCYTYNLFRFFLFLFLVHFSNQSKTLRLSFTQCHSLSIPEQFQHKVESLALLFSDVPIAVVPVAIFYLYCCGYERHSIRSFPKSKLCALSHVMRDICLTATLYRWHQSNFLNDHLARQEDKRGDRRQRKRRNYVE